MNKNSFLNYMYSKNLNKIYFKKKTEKVYMWINMNKHWNDKTVRTIQ